MNCTINEYVDIAWCGGTYRDEPTDDVINEFMIYNNIDDRGLGEKYFNKKCCSCDKRIKDKNTLAMNMKIHGRDTDKFYCKKCFKKIYDLSEDDWNNRIKMFKQSNCNLF